MTPPLSDRHNSTERLEVHNPGLGYGDVSWQKSASRPRGTGRISHGIYLARLFLSGRNAVRVFSRLANNVIGTQGNLELNMRTRGLGLTLGLGQQRPDNLFPSTLGGHNG